MSEQFELEAGYTTISEDGLERVEHDLPVGTGGNISAWHDNRVAISLSRMASEMINTLFDCFDDYGQFHWLRSPAMLDKLRSVRKVDPPQGFLRNESTTGGLP